MVFEASCLLTCPVEGFRMLSEQYTLAREDYECGAYSDIIRTD